MTMDLRWLGQKALEARRREKEPPKQKPTKPKPTGPAGFWRPNLAFSLDMTILTLFTFLAAYFLGPLLSYLGSWNTVWFVGIFIAYFSIGNSSLQKGATFGKGVLGIKVVDKNGETISPGRSFFRTLPLALILLPVGLESNPPVAAQDTGSSLVPFYDLFLLCYGSVYLYLALFNGKAKRSLDDLLVDTWVVHEASKGPIKEETFWKGHVLIMGALLLLFFWASSDAPESPESAPAPIGVTCDLQLAARSIGAEDVRITRRGFETRGSDDLQGFKVVATFANTREYSENAALELAEVLEKQCPEVFYCEYLQVTVRHGINLGLRRIYKVRHIFAFPEEWKKGFEYPENFEDFQIIKKTEIN